MSRSLQFYSAFAVALIALFAPGRERAPKLAQKLSSTQYPAFGINVKLAPYGAVGDGINDDTEGLQLAIDDAIEAGGDTVLLPRGTYLVSQTLRVEGVTGFVLRGAGAGATTLLWTGNNSDPLLRLADTYSSTIENVFIRSSSGAPLHTALLLENSTPIAVSPSRTTLQNIVIDGTNAGGLEFGVRFALGGGGDNNNDFHVLEKVSVNNYSQAGFSLESAQSKAILFEGCVVSGNGIGEDGVATWRGVGTKGGSFTWIGGGGGGNLHADFHLGDANAPVSISGASFENSSMLLDTEGPSGAMWPVRIRDTRWATQKATTPLQPNGNIIRFQFAGPLTIEGCSISVFDSNLRTGVGRARIQVNSLSLIGFTFVGNSLTLNSQDLFTGAKPTWHASNLIRRDLNQKADLLPAKGF